MSGHPCFHVSAPSTPLHMAQRTAGLADNACGCLQATGEVPEEVMAMQVDPAAFETCGHIVLKRSQDYETVTQVCTVILCI